MSDVDDDMSCVSSNVELIQTQNDALAETAQQDQQRFEELVSDTTAVSGSFERALGQENKACTLLQCKIDVLKRQHAESEKSNEALRKQIYNQQMEMEKISSSIFQQTQEINLKFPSEG